MSAGATATASSMLRLPARGGTSRLAEEWDRFWSAPEAAANLAAARILIAGHALWILLSRDFAGVSALPLAFWSAVEPSARWRFLLWPGHSGLESALTALAGGALVAVILGVATRAAALLAALLLYHLSPLETIILTPSPWLKGLTLSVLALVILALAPSSDALSVRGRPRVDAGRQYGWPLRLIQALVCLVYALGAYAKIFHSGWSWASADNMRAWLLLANSDPEQALFTSPGLWLASHPALCALMGGMTIALEASFPLVLFSTRARRWLVPATAFLHVAILVAMNYAFLNAPQLLVFVDWRAAGRRFSTRSGGSSRPKRSVPSAGEAGFTPAESAEECSPRSGGRSRR